MIRWILLLSSVAALQGQSLSYGLKLGAPVNDPVGEGPFSISSPSRFTGGPFVELHLRWKLSAEFSALYRVPAPYTRLFRFA